MQLTKPIVMECELVKMPSEYDLLIESLNREVKHERETKPSECEETCWINQTGILLSVREVEMILRKLQPKSKTAKYYVCKKCGFTINSDEWKPEWWSFKNFHTHNNKPCFTEMSLVSNEEYQEITNPKIPI